jgi:(p)ppGpp synthase/HD superfamily hydrolase
MNNKERSLLVADKAHASQAYDIYPYGYHIRQVVKIAEELGYDESIIVASALHDTLEDTELSYNDIKKAFGKEVAEIVYCVTDELGRNRKERKEKTYPKIRSNWKATVVKICDRIANLQHAKLYNSRLYEVYQSEHEDFCRNLLNTEHPQNETGKAWQKLNSMVPRTSLDFTERML